MNWESALGSAIEVAIALAGFSGIIAAMGRRGAGRWTAGDQILLRILLTASGVALVWAFLPFVILDAIDPPAFWRIGSGAIACWYIGILVYRIRQTARVRAEAVLRPPPLASFLHVTVIAALLANAFSFAAPSIYVLGVLWELAIAFMAFVALLLASWHVDTDAAPPAA
jgi:hypothetical protein